MLRTLLACSLLALGCGSPSPAPAPSSSSPSPVASTPSPAPTPPLPSAHAPPPPEELPAPAPAASAGARFERRCGWIDNPTPSNWWLIDRDATWVIGLQGGPRADGDLPDFGAAWVETNGHYGHGCACMDVQVDRRAHVVLALRRVQVLPLARCKQDKKLPPSP